MKEKLLEQLLDDLLKANLEKRTILYYIFQGEQELLYTSFKLNNFTLDKTLYFELDNDTRLQIPLENTEVEYDDTKDEEEYIIKSNGLTYYIGIL